MQTHHQSICRRALFVARSGDIIFQRSTTDLRRHLEFSLFLLDYLLNKEVGGARKVYCEWLYIVIAIAVYAAHAYRHTRHSRRINRRLYWLCPSAK